MRRLLLVLFLSGALLNKSAAQDHKNSISVGYGLLTFQDVASVTSDIIISSATDIDEADVTSSGVLYVEYSHYWTNHWRLVVNANYISVKSKLVQKADGQLYGNSHDHYYSLMAGVNYHWIGDAFVELYSGLQIGGSIVNTDQTYVSGDAASDSFLFPAFQVTALGVRIGKKLGGFAELGFGNKGILNVGIDLRF